MSKLRRENYDWLTNVLERGSKSPWAKSIREQGLERHLDMEGIGDALAALGEVDLRRWPLAPEIKTKLRDLSGELRTLYSDMWTELHKKENN